MRAYFFNETFSVAINDKWNPQRLMILSKLKYFLD